MEEERSSVDAHDISEMLEDAPQQRENLREFIDKLVNQGYTVTDTEGPDPELIDPGGRAVETWREDYPYDERLGRGEYEREKYRLQVELLKLQYWGQDHGVRHINSDLDHRRADKKLYLSGSKILRCLFFGFCRHASVHNAGSITCKFPLRYVFCIFLHGSELRFIIVIIDKRTNDICLLSVVEEFFYVSVCTLTFSGIYKIGLHRYASCRHFVNNGKIKIPV